MTKQTLGMMISSLRKEKGMTQLELAEKMGVTDKVVSKWERDLSFPDIYCTKYPEQAERWAIRYGKNTDFYYQPRDYIAACYEDGVIL